MYVEGKALLQGREKEKRKKTDMKKRSVILNMLNAGGCRGLGSASEPILSG
jgi:hypothetical protein